MAQVERMGRVVGRLHARGCRLQCAFEHHVVHYGAKGATGTVDTVDTIESGRPHPAAGSHWVTRGISQ